jgi:pimeloyl-ACP methyl ester carboxylesterase
VQAKGYPCEFHQVVTEDGYILGMYHIPHGIKNGASTSRPPVLVQHGLVDWSFTWILNYPNQSLPYILADAGYDVWLGNNRGTTMSRAHQTLSVHEKEFWDFSFDQFASRDLPAMITYINTMTNTQKISYIGHSQGTLQMFAALTESDNMVRNHINGFVALAPVAYVEYLESEAIVLLANKHVPDALYLFGIYQFPGPETPCMQNLLSSLCYVQPGICTNVVEILCGHNKGAFNNSRMDVMGAHEPGDTSVVNMDHWSQAVRSGTFQKYNFGPIYNEKFYGTKEPPVYNLTNIPTYVPISLFSGGHDKLADPRDVANLAAQLPGGPDSWSKTPQYAHLDFVWAIDAAELIYPDVLKQLAKYNA